MNKIRISGIAVLIVSLFVHLYLDNDNYSFWAGAAGAVGGVLALTGRFRKAP